MNVKYQLVGTLASLVGSGRSELEMPGTNFPRTTGLLLSHVHEFPLFIYCIALWVF